MIDVLLAAVASAGGIGGLTGFYLYFSRWASRKAAINSSCRKAAQACGVTDLQWSRWSTGKANANQESCLFGRWGSLSVRFNARAAGLAIVIGGPSSLVADVSMRLERTVASPYRRLSPEIEIGDPEFDAEVYVEGPAPLLRALLDEGTRPGLLRLLRGRATEQGKDRLLVQIIVLHGHVHAEVSRFEPGASWSALLEALGLLLETAGLFVTGQDLPVRLARNARHETLAAVRAANLSTLAQEYPDADLSRDTVRAACEDTSEEVRLQAAIALGPEGRALLLALATRAEAGEHCATRAVDALGAGLPADAGAALLERAMRAGQTSLALACLAGLGSGGAAEAVSTLAGVLGGGHAKLGAAAARALGRTRRAEAEGPLLLALGHASEAVRLAAAESLGEVGTPTAVLPLQEMAERESGDVRRAARTAVAQIQARIRGASPGQLSLSAGEAGHVSLSDGESGRVSLPREPA